MLRIYIEKYANNIGHMTIISSTIDKERKGVIKIYVMGKNYSENKLTHGWG